MRNQEMAILQGRQRLEATLSSPALADKENVLRLVSSQLATSAASSPSSSPSLPASASLHADSSSRIAGGTNHIPVNVQNLFEQVWTLLELMRSASGDMNHSLSSTTDEDTASEGWKLKHHTGQLRVMYREGPEGTPFHILLAEGLIYSPITSALCLAWEAPSYNLWWPQMMIPPFKVTESRWIKCGFNGEDISLIRVKVPWPLAAREVLMCAFALEVFDEELVIVLLHSFPETAESLCGVKPLEIPDASPDVVRMELAGGFALQKVSQEQSYFRTVASLDVKLDLVPPWLINFISRQLIGLGFKLYQKTLISINKGEGSSSHFQKLIDTEPMYERIRKGLRSKKANDHAEANALSDAAPNANSSEIEALELSKVDEEQSNGVSSYTGHRVPVLASEDKSGLSTIPCCGTNVTVDPDVQKALNVLDQMISLVQSRKIGASPIGSVSISSKSGTALNTHTQSVYTQCNDLDGTSQNEQWAMTSPPRQLLIRSEEPPPRPETLEVEPHSKWFCLDSSRFCCG